MIWNSFNSRDFENLYPYQIKNILRGDNGKNSHTLLKGVDWFNVSIPSGCSFSTWKGNCVILNCQEDIEHETSPISIFHALSNCISVTCHFFHNQQCGWIIETILNSRYHHVQNK